jgi:hypothetical protein
MVQNTWHNYAALYPPFYLRMGKESSIWNTGWQMRNNVSPEHNILLAEYYRNYVYSSCIAKILFQAPF